jgi:multidrug efflux pump subunit AcrA (membrane-fusion protein)
MAAAQEELNKGRAALREEQDDLINARTELQRAQRALEAERKAVEQKQRGAAAAAAAADDRVSGGRRSGGKGGSASWTGLGMGLSNGAGRGRIARRRASLFATHKLPICTDPKPHRSGALPHPSI